MDANSGKPWSEMDISDLTPSTTGTRSRKQRASCAGTRMRCARRRRSLGWSSSQGSEASSASSARTNAQTR